VGSKGKGYGNIGGGGLGQAYEKRTALDLGRGGRGGGGGGDAFDIPRSQGNNRSQQIVGGEQGVGGGGGGIGRVWSVASGGGQEKGLTGGRDTHRTKRMGVEFPDHSITLVTKGGAEKGRKKTRVVTVARRAVKKLAFRATRDSWHARK